MTNEELELIRVVVDRANGAASDYDLDLVIIEETPDHVKVGIGEGGESTLEAHIRVLGDYSYTDGDRIIENTLLGVRIDDDKDVDHPWRIIDARGTSLFAVLYV